MSHRTGVSIQVHLLQHLRINEKHSQLLGVSLIGRFAKVHTVVRIHSDFLQTLLNVDETPRSYLEFLHGLLRDSFFAQIANAVIAERPSIREIKLHFLSVL